MHDVDRAPYSIILCHTRNVAKGELTQGYVALFSLRSLVKGDNSSDVTRCYDKL